MAEKTPTALVYTESIGAPDTYSVTIDDPNAAKKVLDVLLNTPVSRLGCQVDMAQMQYGEYCFSFGNETFTFGFLPHSYFCYNRQDYELGENRLNIRRRDECSPGAGDRIVRRRLPWTDQNGGFAQPPRKRTGETDSFPF